MCVCVCCVFQVTTAGWRTNQHRLRYIDQFNIDIDIDTQTSIDSNLTFYDCWSVNSHFVKTNKQTKNDFSDVIRLRT